jgi:hypothetical protein
MFADIGAAVEKASTGRLDHDALRSFLAAEGLPFDDFCNAFALTVARRFDDSTMTYHAADAAMNALSGMMTSHLASDDEANLPEPAWSIFLAFDAGEYDRGDGANPVERFTMPQIKRILRDA